MTHSRLIAAKTQNESRQPYSAINAAATSGVMALPVARRNGSRPEPIPAGPQASTSPSHWSRLGKLLLTAKAERKSGADQ